MIGNHAPSFGGQSQLLPIRSLQEVEVSLLVAFGNANVYVLTIALEKRLALKNAECVLHPLRTWGLVLFLVMPLAPTSGRNGLERTGQTSLWSLTGTQA